MTSDQLIAIIGFAIILCSFGIFTYLLTRDKKRR